MYLIISISTTSLLMLQKTGDSIPTVVESCIRALNFYGMRHEGIFRVSGLHAEINDLKAAFEKGLLLNALNFVYLTYSTGSGTH